MASDDAPQQSSGPVPASKLTELATDACKATFESAQAYDHSQTTTWNQSIINAILKSLISETSADSQKATHKFAVTSTIIQHTPIAEAVEAEEGAAGGKRGMHSATGGFWDNARDGLWNYKHEEDQKGLDVVITVVWISVP